MLSTKEHNTLVTSAFLELPKVEAVEQHGLVGLTTRIADAPMMTALACPSSCIAVLFQMLLLRELRCDEHVTSLVGK